MGQAGKKAGNAISGFLVKQAPAIDISNCCRPLNMYLKWSTVLVAEFFLQGDNEKARGDPVSPFMDRYVVVLRSSKATYFSLVSS